MACSMVWPHEPRRHGVQPVHVVIPGRPRTTVHLRGYRIMTDAVSSYPLGEVGRGRRPLVVLFG
jgi:hypothetical protein